MRHDRGIKLPTYTHIKSNNIGEGGEADLTSSFLGALVAYPHVCSNLSTLDISNTESRHLTAKTLAECMEKGALKSLTHLDYCSYNAIGHRRVIFTSKGDRERLLYPSLTHLNLSCNAIKDLLSLHAICRALSLGGAEGLETLDASANELGSNIMHLARVLNTKYLPGSTESASLGQCL